MSAFTGKASITRKKRISVRARRRLVRWYKALSQNTMSLWCSKCSRDDMNSSMYTANRTTHLKIVVVGIATALMIAVIRTGRANSIRHGHRDRQTPTVIKAGGPVVFADRSGPVIWWLDHSALRAHPFTPYGLFPQNVPAAGCPLTPERHCSCMHHVRFCG